MNEDEEGLVFADALGLELEDELRTSPIVPDLADVFARARAIDESAIPNGLHPDVDLPGLDPDDEELADDVPLGLDLGAFASAMREEVEQDLDETQRARPQRRRVASLATIAAVAAALLVAFISLPRLMPLIAEQGVDPGPVVEPHLREGDTEALEFEAHGERPRRPKPAPAPRPEPPEIEETVPEPPPAEPEPEVAPRKRPKPRASLADLEAEAKALWASGDLEAAETTLRKVIARAGRGERAELAYGDLFAIARQRAGGSAQAKVWREYLRRFPNGRYADDARGGLCRRATDDDRSACWADYLADHPNGVHAAEARRATEAP